MVSDAAIHLMEGGSAWSVRAPADLLEPSTYIDRLSAYGVTSTGIHQAAQTGLRTQRFRGAVDGFLGDAR
jgi:hypothetical protein